MRPYKGVNNSGLYVQKERAVAVRQLFMDSLLL
jgi:hypothetical protein